MYCHPGQLSLNRYGRYAGGYDTFNRVLGREYQPACGPREQSSCGPCGSYGMGGAPQPAWGLPRGRSPYGPTEPYMTSNCRGVAPAPYRGASSVTNALSRLEGSVIHEEPTPVKYGERSVKKLVQVPVTREVKVPDTIEKVVEGVDVKEIPVTKVRQEQVMKTVNEEYVDFEEREATRMKEVWVRQEVPERYVERVPVKKVRTVQVPHTETREYTEMQRIEVPYSRVVQEPGFRVDQVVEYETHEVEGRQRVEWIPHVVEDVVGERDLGVRDRHVVEHKTGQVVYPEYGERHLGPDGLDAGRSYGAMHDVHHSPIRDGYAGGSYIPASSVPYTPMTSAPVPPYGYPTPVVGGDAPFGIFVKESVIGLVVRTVAPGSPAAVAGIAPGDVLVSADGLELYSLDNWRYAIDRKNAVTVTYRSKRLGRVHKVLLVE